MVVDFPLFVVIGFLAQLVDGALGMAYGVISTSLLLGLGVPPAFASASIHAAEVVTTGVSGLSHALFRNIDRALFRQIVVPGVIGGVAGAWLLSGLPGEYIRPFVAAYLLLMGLLILGRAWRRAPPKAQMRSLAPLGLAGGFLDAIGGGGWGPIVASTLMASGTHPRFAVGSVNLAEFFVTLAISATFLATIGFVYWQIIAGLILGGVAAAPLAAFVARRVQPRPLMLVVGSLVILVSLLTILSSLTGVGPGL